MAPYVDIDIVKGVAVASGCIGELWQLLASLLHLNSIYSVSDRFTKADVVLVGATAMPQEATQLAFISSWYVPNK